MNVLNMPLNLKICTINNERDILDQKLKVKKCYNYCAIKTSFIWSDREHSGASFEI